MFFIMQKRLNHCYLLFLLTLYIKGHQGFFIKHSSGLCLQSAPQYRVRGNDKASDPVTSRWGPLYVVHFYTTCLHPDAQFRFFEPYSVLHNIGKNGTFFARNPSEIGSKGYKKRFHIYHSPIPPAADVFIYSQQFALKQRPKGALQLNNGYCPTPVKQGGNLRRPFYPQNGNEVYHTKNCDIEDQTFIFGSVTCEGNVATDASCHKDQVMVIHNAVYGGRSDMKTCGYNEDTNCTVSVTCVVKRQCDGKQKCSINVNQTLFNIDPCPGKSKYLYFEFICADTKPAKQLDRVSDVKLSSSVLPNEGYLEIGTINSKINKVCDGSVNNKVKEIVCRQFGYQGVKKEMFSAFVDNSNSDRFSGDINCGGEEQRLSHCCVTESSHQSCSKLANVSCLICSEPLLEDRSNFPGSIFTAINSIHNHSPDKARISSGSSWCASSNAEDHLEIDLRVRYVINNVAIFGDAVSANWVISFKLSYTSDGKNWVHGIAGTNKEILGNKNAYNDVSTINLNGVRVRILRFIPVSSHGNPCMRIELCGHKLFPDQPRKLNLTKPTSSYVSFSWIPPIIDKWEKPILYYRIKMQENISRSVVLNINHANAINEKEVQDLLPYTAYDLSIAAGNVYGFGRETTAIFTTAETAPSGPPRDVSVIAQSASSLSASWKEPVADKKNGVITNYTVCISQFKDGPCFQKRTTVDKTLIIDKLKSSSKYFVSVLASTKVGSGNFSESKARFTNAKPLKQSFNRSSNTLSFMLEIPSGEYSYFQVIAVKLFDGKTPSSSPDSYSENDLHSYDDAKSSSQPKKPYIAAVLRISKESEKEFKLGDGRYFVLAIKRRRRSSSGVFFNGPLEPGTSYSVFQRVYKEKDNYYSSGWSPAAETENVPEKSTTRSAKILLYIVIAISWVISAVLIVVVVYITVCRPKSHSPTTRSKVISNTENTNVSEDTYEEVQIPSTTEAAVSTRNCNIIEKMKMNIIINLFRRRLKHENSSLKTWCWTCRNFRILCFKCNSWSFASYCAQMKEHVYKNNSEIYNHDNSCEHFQCFQIC